MIKVRIPPPPLSLHVHPLPDSRNATLTVRSGTSENSAPRYLPYDARARAILAERFYNRKDGDVDYLVGFLVATQDWFKQFPPALIAAVARHLTYEKHAAGCAIFEQGDVATCMYVVMSGKVSVNQLSALDAARPAGLSAQPASSTTPPPSPPAGSPAPSPGRLAPGSRAAARAAAMAHRQPDVKKASFLLHQKGGAGNPAPAAAASSFLLKRTSSRLSVGGASSPSAGPTLGLMMMASGPGGVPTRRRSVPCEGGRWDHSAYGPQIALLEPGERGGDGDAFGGGGEGGAEAVGSREVLEPTSSALI